MSGKLLKIGDFTVTSGFRMEKIPASRLVIQTINAYSWTIAERLQVFKQALLESDVLLPDGVSIVLAARLLTGQRIKKMAGADIHRSLLGLLQASGGSCFYLGASGETLSKIKNRINTEYPSVRIASYSPPFKRTFTEEENDRMCEAVNIFAPDVLFIGMTAPKQELWVYANKERLQAKVICTVGAVFDFYAGTQKRPSPRMQRLGLEWFGRLLKNPRRLWKRYLIFNFVFLYQIFALWKSKRRLHR
ncbi:MAG: WecB/TagA/CpsF family glycosyltransferase [Tannerellaceae bacterium]|jgi:N-acetylglucosaminyldiphosphoundecaprenol N-acetyl-beta-D-mannosaminyltransferase|nr:WecB/TagA/CpsF family glycosyltransferase [Tannerellaceae bacterium]